MGAKDTTDTAAPAMVALTMDQLTALIAAARPDMEAQAALIKLQAEENAKAHQKLTRPENPNLPPDPRPEFIAHKVRWAGTHVTREVCTAVEISLLNKLEPGAYMCSKADGTKFPVTVEITKNNATGAVEDLSVAFVTKGDAKNGLMPLATMCRELLDQADARRASVKVA
jgi:hypothetical protein